MNINPWPDWVIEWLIVIRIFPALPSSNSDVGHIEKWSSTGSLRNGWLSLPIYAESMNRWLVRLVCQIQCRTVYGKCWRWRQFGLDTPFGITSRSCSRIFLLSSVPRKFGQVFGSATEATLSETNIDFYYSLPSFLLDTSRMAYLPSHLLLPLPLAPTVPFPLVYLASLLIKYHHFRALAKPALHPFSMWWLRHADPFRQQ